MIGFDKGFFDMICLPRGVAEALLGAPPVCLKLYIYGLLRKDGEIAAMSEELGEPIEAIDDALQYLKERGFIASRGAEHIIYLPPEEEDVDETVYSDSENAATLQALFSDRLLSSKDYTALRECTSVYGLSVNVVNILVEHCILTSRANNRVSMSYIQKKAAEWAEEGIDTIELAQYRVLSERSDSQNLKELLLRMGIRGRHASAEEKKLYDKWTNAYGMDIDAIYAALPAMLSAQNPSMKYLDRIIDGLYKEGRTTAAAISKKLTDNELNDERIKRLLESIGTPRRTVTEEMRRLYTRFLSMGFSEDAILYAGKRAMMDGYPSLKNVDMILSGWASRGTVRMDDIRAMIDGAQAARERARHMLKEMGITGAPGDKDIAMVNRYLQKGMGEDVIMFAAKLAYGATSPRKLAETILKNWAAIGVKTLDEAKKENEKHRSPQKSTNNERQYTEEELDSKLRDPLENF